MESKSIDQSVITRLQTEMFNLKRIQEDIKTHSYLDQLQDLKKLLLQITSWNFEVTPGEIVLSKGEYFMEFERASLELKTVSEELKKRVEESSELQELMRNKDLLGVIDELNLN